MTPAEALAVEAREEGITPLEALLRRGRLRATLTMLGPAFVASIAYVDPGNFATNIAGGARFGYLLLWVVLAANLMAMLIQYLSAKLGIVTDRNLPESFRAHYPRWTSWGMWVQAEIISMSTDIAEFLGAALGLNLLFHVPLFIAGVMTGFIAFGLLELRRRGYRPVRARDHGAARDHLPRLPLRDASRSGPPRTTASRASCRLGSARPRPCTSRSGSSARPSCRTPSISTPRSPRAGCPSTTTPSAPACFASSAPT